MNVIKPRKNSNLIRTHQLLEEIQDEELINRQIENLMINPYWEKSSEETDVQFEGCMSVPQIWNYIYRKSRTWT